MSQRQVNLDDASKPIITTQTSECTQENTQPQSNQQTLNLSENINSKTISKRGRKPRNKTKAPGINTMESHQQTQLGSQCNQLVRRSVRIAQREHNN